MRRVITLLLCLVSYVGQAQTTASTFVDRLIDIEMELQQDYLRIEFANLCDTHVEIEQNDYNYEQFARVILAHQLFTTNDTYNGATLTGDIPYITHYSEPNPRHDIMRDGQTINGIPVGKRTLADLDRTPNIFLRDFFSDSKYSHPVYGDFSTFGWCSEREMAYAVVMSSLGYRTFINAPGIHAWTNVRVIFDGYNGRTAFTAGVDNTYNDVTWSSSWTTVVDYSSGLEKYYNMQSSKYADMLNNVYVSPARGREIMNMYSIYK